MQTSQVEGSISSMKHSGILSFYHAGNWIIREFHQNLSGLAEKGVHKFKLVEYLQVFDPLSHANILDGDAKLV